MSNKRGIGLTVLVCIITSVLTSLLTIVVMKNNIGDTNQNSVSKEIVVNDSGKSQNIYHAVSDVCRSLAFSLCLVFRPSLVAGNERHLGIGAGIGGAGGGQTGGLVPSA